MNERLKNRRRLKTLQAAAAAAARICHFYKVLAVKWFEGKWFVFLYNLSVLYIYEGDGGVARLIYAQYAHLYYYGLWMRSTRINLIESSMCHKNPETEMEKEKEKENEREGGRELDWNSSQAKWQLPRPRQVAGQAPSSRRGTNNNNNNSTLWKVGGNQLTRLIGGLRDWQTLPRLSAIWHCLYRLLIRCTICIYI